MSAFYNEPDPYAAAWLENLIVAGHIAPGVVDRRPIQEIEAWELFEFTQCHFFAGIGVWSHALRRAGWSDDQPIWTGSCPCQPFSAAGKQKGFADDRHLWPYWKTLIEQRRPAIVVGEQVASALGWLDLVSADMEAAGYAFGAADLCAAGFGGAHIRQRLYFAAVAYADNARSQGRGGMPECADQRAVGSGGVAGGLADACIKSGERDAGSVFRAQEEIGSQNRPVDGDMSLRYSDGCADGGLADADKQGGSGRGICRPGEGTSAGDGTAQQRLTGLREDQHADAPNSGEGIADWLWCRDGKWRPVEPGTFPLVDATAARVGRLRAYGNALDAETATQFCAALRETLDGV